MSEKRFVQVGDTSIKDTLTGEKYYAPCEDGLLDLLNEQQATITHLEKVNGKNFAKRRLLEQDNLILRNENEQLRQELKQMKNVK